VAALAVGAGRLSLCISLDLLRHRLFSSFRGSSEAGLEPMFPGVNSGSAQTMGLWDEDRFRSLVANVPGAVYRCALSSDWDMEFMSEEIEQICGYPASEFLGTPPARAFASVIHEDDRELVERVVDEAVGRREPFVLDYRVVHANGEVRWVHERGRAVFADDGSVLFLDGAIFDHTTKKELEQQLEHLAYHDSLTGLPNRTLFSEHVELALNRAQRRGEAVAVLFIDLDDFKLVNDSFGHQIGDQLLCQVAEKLRSVARATDVIARQGGDEFLILMADLPPLGADPSPAEIASMLAQRIGNVLTEPIVLHGTDVYVSASVGISIYPQDATSADDLLKRADVAMYTAKDTGRNGYELYTDDGTDAMARLSLAARLHRATSENQLVLHYQPLVELQSGQMIGAEALLRWLDPKQGTLIPPAEFIPLAERTGLIGEISEWVINEACRQSASWREHGLDICVSINLPARFWQPTAMRSVLATVESFGLNPNRLMIEITETTAMAHPTRNEAIISELRERGLRVAIDDFGTGHSSLARLNQMLVNTLKIDRSFVGDLPHDPQAAVLVASIIRLAHSLGLQPLAEGIETAAQRDFLLHHGCLLGQGFYYSPPIPPEQIPTFVAPAATQAA
jgi:diguanylate cyclase (GGDEF)-like protein/PAS domain S-box-containing protein